MKKIAILGSTGSIGVQALNVVRKYPQEFQVVALASGGSSPKSKALFEQQRNEFLNPEFAENCALAERDGFVSVINLADPEITGADLVLNGIAGNVGLQPSLRVLESESGILALANKESLVVGGSLVQQMLKTQGSLTDKIYPVDSEHSAIWQCLDGKMDVKKLILTASGGPFRGKKSSDLKNITPEQALDHPTWDMGTLVTINSATLMNKGLELIEAAYLFGVDPDAIEVTVHPQSIVHSMVEFADGAVLAQNSIPSMELPIALALSYPHRLPAVEPALNWGQTQNLTFEPVDEITFPAVKIAKEALKAGPLFPVIMNSVNEKSVEKFLRGEIAFLDIIASVQHALDSFEPNDFASNPAKPTLEEIQNVLRVN